MTLPTIQVSLQGTHEITVFQVAKAFCDMDADQQALFFENVDEITDGWEKQRVFQWQFLRDSIDRYDNKRALKVLRELAEYSK